MNLFKMALKFALLLAGSVAVGMILLCVVFMLPSDPIFKNVQVAGRVFSIEGTYPSMDGTNATVLDNWTDALMLENAFFDKEGAGVLEKAAAVYRPEFREQEPVSSLLQYLAGKQDYDTPSYARYWHGYLVVLKPLLLATNYLGIRGLNRIVQAVVALAAAIAVWRRLSVRYIVPLAAVYIFLRPAAVAFSMQFSAIFYISFLSVLIMAVFYDKLAAKNGIFYFFFFVGIITNYIDFLTYPIAALGIPLTLLLCIERNGTWTGKVKRIIINSFCWGIGYFGMWVGKWVLGSMILGQNVLADAFHQAHARTALEVGQETISRGMAILRNLNTGFGKFGWLAALLFAAIVMAGLLKARGNVKKLLIQSAPFLIICMLPFIWYAVLSNHSYIHHWFTYRALSVSVFAVLCMGLSYFYREPFKQ